MFQIKREVFTWLWSPEWIRRSNYVGRIWTPQEEEDGAIAYFSDLRGGRQVSWLWLFPTQREACLVRTLPTLEGAMDSAELRLIGATLPREIPDESPPTELWRGDLESIISQPQFFDEFDYVRYGFNLDRFKATGGQVSESCAEFEPKDFLKTTKRGLV